MRRFSTTVAILAAPVLAVVLFAAIGINAVSPPSPQSVRRTEPGFSVDRALQDVQHIAQEPHPVGSKAHAAALAYIVSQLRAGSGDVQIQSGLDEGVALINVLARPVNSNSTNLILLVAHYDSVPAGPGAADDAAGVAALLETARVLGDGSSNKNRVAFLITDGEEAGLLGAQMFIRDNAEFLRQVRIVLNFDARGNRGPAIMFETGPRNLALMRLFRSCPYPVATSFAQDVYRRMPNDTDMTEFMKAGKTGYNFAVIEGLEVYHTAADTWQNLDPRALAHYGSYATALARRLAQTDLDSLKSTQDAVSFPVVRGILVVYPESWAMPLAIFALVFYGIVVTVAVIRRRLRIPRVLLGTVSAAAIPALAALMAGLLLTLLERVFESPRWGPYFLFRHSDAIMIACVALTVVSVPALKLWLSRKFGAAELLAGALLTWIALSLSTALWLRGFSYLFLWPSLFGTAALWIILRRETVSTAAAVVAMLCTVAPACVLFAPTILLSYYALTISLLAAWIGLTSHVVSLVCMPSPTLTECPGTSAARV